MHRLRHRVGWHLIPSRHLVGWGCRARRIVEVGLGGEGIVADFAGFGKEMKIVGLCMETRIVG